MRNPLPLLLTIVALVGLTTCESPGGDATPGIDEDARPPRGHAWIIFGNDTVDAEVADTPEARQQGLMGRQSLASGDGLLFVFEEELPPAFYMRNTLLALDIAWLDRSQVIVEIQQMEPETEDLHRPAQAALFALEVPQGWYASTGIQVGHVAQIVLGRL